MLQMDVDIHVVFGDEVVDIEKWTKILPLLEGHA